MDSANAGDVVLLGPGTYFEHDIRVKSGIILLRLAGHPQETVIDAQQLGRGLICDGVDATTRIRELTVRNATIAGDGGGIYCTGGASPRIEHVFVEGCSATRGAGFFAEDAGSPELTSCTFSGNRASGEGGGFYGGGTCCPRFTDCLFSENSAGSGGGGVLSADYLLQNVWPRLTRCHFSDNRAERGGALTTRPHAFVILEECSFTRNSAAQGSQAGGAIFTTSSLAFDACTFTQNRAHRGGAIYAGGGGGFDAWDSLFEANWATDDGGAIYLDGSSASFRESSFMLNSAPNGTGGAVCCYQRACLHLTECLCTENLAATGGVMSSLYWSNTSLTSCTLALNSATSCARAGAALHVDCYSSARVVRCIIADSRAGAAVACESGERARLSCCCVSGNKGGDWIGCIAAQIGVDDNLALRPLFCSPQSGDFSLYRTSPCLPRYSHGCDLIGAFGQGNCESPARPPSHPLSWAMLKARYR
jgi:predicted outer membrane repeat protein